jgi:hypothetical protein
MLAVERNEPFPSRDSLPPSVNVFFERYANYRVIISYIMLEVFFSCYAAILKGPIKFF